MHKNVRSLAAAAVVSLALACVALAQSGTAYLEGTVKGEDGKPLQGAVIKLERVDQQGIYQLKTDKKGHWMQAGMPLGSTFTVSVLVNSKVADVKHKVKPNSEGAILNFDLSQKSKSAAGASR